MESRTKGNQETYWARAAQNALANTRAFFGWNWKSLVFPALYAVGLLIYREWRGPEAAMERLVETIAFGLVPVGGFTLLLFAYNVLKAPPRLDEERQEQFTTMADKVKELQEIIARYKTPVLSATVNPPSEPPPRWVTAQLRVTNGSGKAIHECYAKIIECRPIFKLDSSQYTLPPRDHPLPWSSRSGEVRPTINLGAGDSDVLDVSVAGYGERTFSIPEAIKVSDAAGSWIWRYHRDAYPLPVGEYELHVDLGSRTDDIPRTSVRVSLAYHGSRNIEITEVSDL